MDFKAEIISRWLYQSLIGEKNDFISQNHIILPRCIGSNASNKAKYSSESPRYYNMLNT